MKRLFLVAIALALMVGCATVPDKPSPVKIPDGYSVGKYVGYLYASSIDPGVIVNEWKLTKQSKDEYGGTWERYDNYDGTEPLFTIVARGDSGQIQVYAWAIGGKLYVYESYHEGLYMCYREVEWNEFTMPLKRLLLEIFGLKKDGI